MFFPPFYVYTALYTVSDLYNNHINKMLPNIYWTPTMGKVNVSYMPHLLLPPQWLWDTGTLITAVTQPKLEEAKWADQDHTTQNGGEKPPIHSLWF